MDVTKCSHRKVGVLGIVLVLLSLVDHLVGWLAPGHVVDDHHGREDGHDGDVGDRGAGGQRVVVGLHSIILVSAPHGGEHPGCLLLSLEDVCWLDPGAKLDQEGC